MTQRYPAAGRPNVTVKLGLVHPRDARAKWIELGPNGSSKSGDLYLARVAWLPDASGIVFERESRDQQRLDLVVADAASLHQRTVLSETSKTWINLHDDLRFLKHEDAFIWASESSGHKHLYVVGRDGARRRALTQGDWDVDKLLALDENAGVVYFLAGRNDPLQQHVFAVKLDGSEAASPRRLSTGEGWHDADFGESASAYVDTYSDPATPPQVSLRKSDGSLIAWIEPNKLDEHHAYAPYRDDLIQPEFGTLAAEDGQKLYYRVYKPADFDAKKKYPVFMTYYGGPGRQYVNKAWGNHFEQYMAQHGYVVFALDNRGSPRRGPRVLGCDFPAARQGRGRRSARGHRVAQAAAVCRRRSHRRVRLELRRLHDADAAVEGVKSDRDRCCSRAGDRLGDSTIRPIPSVISACRRTNAQAYELSGVLRWLDGLKSPLLLVHGMADDNVLFTNSTKLMAALQQHDVQFRLMTYPGGKHGLAGPVCASMSIR